MTTPTASTPAQRAPQIAVASSYPVADFGQETLIRLASAAPAESTDLLDQALARSTTEPLVAEAYDPGTEERPYSLANVQGVEALGEQLNLIVMRGEVSAVLAACEATREQQALANRHANAMQKLGRRCIAVATTNADKNADEHAEEPSGYQLAGVLSFGLGTPKVYESQTRGGFARVEMWPAALRIQHWVNLVLMIIMTATGYYIMKPFFGPTLSEDTGYLMGYIRFAHIVAGFAWIVLGFWRLSLLFVAKERHLRWRALWPVYNKEDFKNLLGTAQYYLFLKKEGPEYIGHNAMQQFTYTGIYALCIIQMLTGLGLYGLYDQSNFFFHLLSYPVHWIGIPAVRLIHAMIMFIIWAFAILHVYLVFRADALEKNGGASSMINGAVWVPTGTKPVDGPEVQ